MWHLYQGHNLIVNLSFFFHSKLELPQPSCRSFLLFSLYPSHCFQRVSFQRSLSELFPVSAEESQGLKWAIHLFKPDVSDLPSVNANCLFMQIELFFYLLITMILVFLFIFHLSEWRVRKCATIQTLACLLFLAVFYIVYFIFIKLYFSPIFVTL